MKKYIFVLLMLFGYSSHAFSGFASDIDLFLVHNGVSVQLFAGAKDSSFGPLVTIFDDESTNLSTGTTPYPVNMKPADLLSDFDDSQLNGLWELHILDDFVPDEGDSLVSWSIFGTLNTSDVFNFNGLSAVNVDTIPETIVSLSVLDFGSISDINVGITVSPNPVPVPAAVWLFGSGLIGLIGMRKNLVKLPGNYALE